MADNVSPTTTIAAGRARTIDTGSAVQNGIPANLDLVNAGVLGPGTYAFRLPIIGSDSVTVLTNPKTVNIAGGAITATLAPALADDRTADPTFAAVTVTLTQAVAAKSSGTGFGGARYAILTIVIPASSALDFTGGLCEYRSY